MVALSLPQLVSVQVVGLLGQFDHTIKINPDDEFVIIHGPNGIGKTKFLELISSVYAVNLAGLLTIPFDVVRFIFTDGTLLSVDRQQQLTLSTEEEDTDTRLVFNLCSPDGSDHKWAVSSNSFETPPGYLSNLDRRLRVTDPGWKRTAPRRWENLRTGESWAF